MKHDAVVVGGSFAGLSFARSAAVRGLRVALLERKTDPGAAVRTTGLLVDEAVEAWDLPSRFLRPLRGVRLYAPSLRWIDLERPGYTFYATDTPALMRWMTEDARNAGVEVHLGRRFGEAGLPSAPWIIGADGPRSSVARAFGLGRNRSFLAGLEVEMDGVGGLDPGRIHVFLDARLAPGYVGWAFPGVGGITQVGLAARRGRPLQLDRFLRKLSTLFDFSRARIVGRRGGLIPVGGPVAPAAAPGVLLVGDAAGLVSPLTAGGIHTAIRSGRLAAHLLADHLLAGGPAPDIAMAGRTPSFRWKQVLRVGIDRFAFNGVYDALIGSRAFAALASSVFFQSRGLLSIAGWADLFSKLMLTAGPRRRIFVAAPAIKRDD